MLSEKRPRDIHSPGSSPRPHKVPNTATIAVAVTATVPDSSTTTFNSTVVLNDHNSMDAFLACAASLRQDADAGIGATAPSPVATTTALPTPLSVEELMEIRGRALAAAQAALRQFNERRAFAPATAAEEVELREATLKVWRAHEDVEAKQAQMRFVTEAQMDVDG